MTEKVRDGCDGCARGDRRHGACSVYDARLALPALPRRYLRIAQFHTGMPCYGVRRENRWHPHEGGQQSEGSYADAASLYGEAPYGKDSSQGLNRSVPTPIE